MRSMLVALTLAYGLLGMADLALASVYGSGHIYVPGQIRDGIYIRPHFVAAPAERAAPGPALKQPPVLDLAPGKKLDALGQPS
jgi:hypothetical protein